MGVNDVLMGQGGALVEVRDRSGMGASHGNGFG